MNGYADELGWGAVWLLRATNDSSYKKILESVWTEFKLDEMIDKAYAAPTGKPRFFWDDKTPGVWLLAAKLTGEEKYKTLITKYMDFLVKEAPKSPKGMVFYAEIWGTLRHSSNAAFLALQVCTQSMHSKYALK